VSEVEQNIVSVERILHYVELSPEAPYEIPETQPHDWPSSGEIKFQYVFPEHSLFICFNFLISRNYSTRYRPELDLVLKDINISIVGRFFSFTQDDMLTYVTEREREDRSMWADWVWKV
jgi:ATP-binding cassette, subfamily C (CFTR/MRP), member 1